MHGLMGMKTKSVLLMSCTLTDRLDHLIDYYVVEGITDNCGDEITSGDRIKARVTLNETLSLTAYIEGSPLSRNESFKIICNCLYLDEDTLYAHYIGPVPQDSQSSIPSLESFCELSCAPVEVKGCFNSNVRPRIRDDHVVSLFIPYEECSSSKYRFFVEFDLNEELRDNFLIGGGLRSVIAEFTLRYKKYNEHERAGYFTLQGNPQILNPQPTPLPQPKKKRESSSPFCLPLSRRYNRFLDLYHVRSKKSDSNI